jgi:hypothetical protein
LHRDRVAVADELGDYPEDGTPEEKWAWARASTALLTDQANTASEHVTAQWLDADGEDWENDGWAEDWSQPRSVDAKTVLPPARAQRAREPRTRRAPVRRRNVRTGSRKARAPGSQEDSEPPPASDLARTAAVSARLRAKIARRERCRFRLPRWEVAG